MEQNKAYISFKIEGKREGQNLHPELLDISEIREMLTDIESLLLPYTKDRKQNAIAYRLEEGSVLHKFIVPTVLALSFQSILDRLATEKDLSILEKKQIEIFEKYQRKAKAEDLHFSLVTSEGKQEPLKIHKNTKFSKREAVWVDTEETIYGEVFEAGGKEKTNIHLNSPQYGTLIIKATKEQAQTAGELLYQEVALVVRAKQNLDTGELKDLVLVSFDNFKPQYDAEALEAIIKRVTPKWADKSVDEWLYKIRN